MARVAALDLREAPSPPGLLTFLAWLDPKEIIGLPFALFVLWLVASRAPTIPPGSGTIALAGFLLIAGVWLIGIALTLVGPARRWLRSHPLRRRATRLVRDVTAVGLCFAVYGSLQWAVPLVNPSLYDHDLARFDRLLFVGHDPALLFDPLVSPVLTLLFSALYFLHFPLFFLTPLVLFWQQRERERADVTLGLMLAMYLGYVGYFLVPAYGPLYGLADAFVNPLPDNQLRDVVRGYGASLGTFPSLHAGIAAVVVGFAWRHHRRLFPLLLAVALGIWASTLYLRYHYVIDLLAGWALAAGCVWLAPRLNRAREQWLASRRARQARVRIARRAWTSVACSVRVLLG
jgi:membrane-associated phospholipid phosphatase